LSHWRQITDVKEKKRERHKSLIAIGINCRRDYTNLWLAVDMSNRRHDCAGCGDVVETRQIERSIPLPRSKKHQIIDCQICLQCGYIVTPPK